MLPSQQGGREVLLFDLFRPQLTRLSAEENGAGEMRQATDRTTGAIYQESETTYMIASKNSCGRISMTSLMEYAPRPFRLLMQPVLRSTAIDCTFEQRHNMYLDGFVLSEVSG